MDFHPERPVFMQMGTVMNDALALAATRAQLDKDFGTLAAAYGLRYDIGQHCALLDGATAPGRQAEILEEVYDWAAATEEYRLPSVLSCIGHASLLNAFFARRFQETGISENRQALTIRQTLFVSAVAAQRATVCLPLSEQKMAQERLHRAQSANAAVEATIRAPISLG